MERCVHFYDGKKISNAALERILLNDCNTGNETISEGAAWTLRGYGVIIVEVCPSSASNPVHYFGLIFGLR